MDAPTGGAVDRKKTGLVTMLAGAGFVLAPPLSQAADGFWILMLVGFALMLYAIPKLHAFQAPADGAAGLWGSRLVLLGAGLILALGLIYLVWEAVGTPPEEAGWVDVTWMAGFISFLVGILAFTIGAVQAKVFPQAAPVLMLIALIGAVAVDMATGAFFEDDTGTTTEWGFLFGVPLFGLGLAWIGYSLWSEVRTEPAAPSETPVP